MATKLIYPALQDYQRRWRGYEVDKNLEDDWLERLNALTVFRLVNVCEGHHACYDSYPLVVLLANDCYVDALTDKKNNAFTQGIADIVQSDTTYRLTYSFGISNDSDSFFCGNKVKLSLVRDEPRQSIEILPNDMAWFRNAVESLEKIDNLFLTEVYDTKG